MYPLSIPPPVSFPTKMAFVHQPKLQNPTLPSRLGSLEFVVSLKLATLSYIRTPSCRRNSRERSQELVERMAFLRLFNQSIYDRGGGLFLGVPPATAFPPLAPQPERIRRLPTTYNPVLARTCIIIRNSRCKISEVRTDVV